MDIPDIIPLDSILKAFNIPTNYSWLLYLIIFIIGYISVKYFLKFHNFKNKVNGLDIIFLIAIFGIIILLKTFFLLFWFIGMWYSIIQSFDELTYIVMIFFSLGILLISLDVTRIDFNSIRNKKFDIKKGKEIGRIILSICLCIIFLVAIYLAWNNYQNDPIIPLFILLVFSCISTINPLIHYFVKWFKKIS